MRSTGGITRLVRFVLDLSVLFDINHADLLERFLHLPVDVLMSDAQLAKCEEDQGLDINRYLSRMICSSYDATEMTQVALLIRQYPKLSFDDLVAYLLAKREKAILLTGDRDLTRLARKSSIECHGTLWVLEYLVDAQLLSAAEASNALKIIEARPSYLPRLEIDRLLRRWCAK